MTVDFGVSGYGKGLMDAMSGFGVKDLLKNAIITEDFIPQSAYGIYEYLSNCNNHDNRNYILLNEEINSKRIIVSNQETVIMSYQKLHMIAFFLDNTIQR